MTETKPADRLKNVGGVGRLDALDTPVQSEPSAEAEPLWHSHTEGPWEIRVTDEKRGWIEIKVAGLRKWIMSAGGYTKYHNGEPEDYIGIVISQENAALLIASADPTTGLKASHAAIARLEAERDRDRAAIRRLELAFHLAVDDLREVSCGGAADAPQYLKDADTELAATGVSDAVVQRQVVPQKPLPNLR